MNFVSLVVSMLIYLNLFLCLLLSIKADFNYESPINKESDMSLWIDEMQVKEFFNGTFFRCYFFIDDNSIEIVF